MPSYLDVQDRLTYFGINVRVVGVWDLRNSSAIDVDHRCFLLDGFISYLGFV